MPNIDIDRISSWLKSVINSENGLIGDINYIFCSDDYLLDMNIQYLEHNYYTDVITFDYCEDNLISGDIFISIDRVYDNAKQFDIDNNSELNRVIVHGLLHLLGFKDKKDNEKNLMRKTEDFYLNILE